MYPASTRRLALLDLKAGLTVAEISRRRGVHRSTIRAWRDHDPGMADPHACPRCFEAVELPGVAYAALLGYYLGDGCLSEAARQVSLRVACDATLPGIIDDVTAQVLAVHPARPVHRVHAPGVVEVQQGWKHWPCLFPQHGPGRKHERPIVLEDWQRAIVVEHPGDFLRGLFHSDGCRVANWASRVVDGERRRHDYPRWQFTNTSEDILGLCGWALDLVDVAWRRSNAKTVSVSRRAAVAALDDLIGLKS